MTSANQTKTTSSLSYTSFTESVVSKTDDMVW
jgi:hypothetical protein